MTGHIYLKVRQDDIDEAATWCDNRSNTCPIARSLKRRFPGEYVGVHQRGAIVGSLRYRLSAPARNFVNKADYGRCVKPATFKLTLRDG